MSDTPTDGLPATQYERRHAVLLEIAYNLGQQHHNTDTNTAHLFNANQAQVTRYYEGRRDGYDNSTTTRTVAPQE